MCLFYQPKMIFVGLLTVGLYCMISIVVLWTISISLLSFYTWDVDADELSDVLTPSQLRIGSITSFELFQVGVMSSTYQIKDGFELWQVRCKSNSINHVIV